MPFPQRALHCAFCHFLIRSCWVVQDQIRFPLIFLSLRQNNPSSVSLSLYTLLQPHNHPGGSLLDLQKESKTPSRKQKNRKSFCGLHNKKPLPLYIGQIEIPVECLKMFFKISEIWIDVNYEYLSKISEKLTKYYMLIFLIIEKFLCRVNIFFKFQIGMDYLNKVHSIVMQSTLSSSWAKGHYHSVCHIVSVSLREVAVKETYSEYSKKSAYRRRWEDHL